MSPGEGALDHGRRAAQQELGKQNTPVGVPCPPSVIPPANSNRKWKAKGPGDTVHAGQPSRVQSRVRRAKRYGGQEGARGEQPAYQCTHFTDRDTESPQEERLMKITPPARYGARI